MLLNLIIAENTVFDKKKRNLYKLFAGIFLHRASRCYPQSSCYTFMQSAWERAEKLAVGHVLDETEVKQRKVPDADCVLFSAEAVWKKGKSKLLEDPLSVLKK